MITLRAPRLVDFIYVAARLAPEDMLLYYEMSGLNYNSEMVAAQMFIGQGGKRWAFVDRYDSPVALGGYDPAGNGIWRSWFMATGEAWMRPNGRQVTDLVSGIIRDMFKDEYVTRLETSTLATRTRARDWYEQIGLTYESTARKASASGQDLVTYVAVKD